LKGGETEERPGVLDHTISSVLKIKEESPLLFVKSTDTDVTGRLCASLSTNNHGIAPSMTTGKILASTGMMISPSSSSTFPYRLHDMLNDAPQKGFEDVVCWRDDDRSFLVRDKDRFSSEVLPNYFQGQTHYKSFQRQRKFFLLLCSL
jgi:hypothetical protein